MNVPIPIRCALSIPFRMVGISRSKMNPNICTICERAFRRVQRKKHISATASILFADIRGYTFLSDRIPRDRLIDIVSTFHDHCAKGVWRHDGIVNKQMGDGLMVIFNFPIKNERHAEAAIAAVLDIQRQCKQALRGLVDGIRITLAGAIGVGVCVGVHTGEGEIGEFSTARSDFTAIGGTVNLAARLESQGSAGEILVDAGSAALACDSIDGAESRMLELKGIEGLVPACVLGSAVRAALPA
jgi:adenylate cyclase